MTTRPINEDDSREPVEPTGDGGAADTGGDGVLDADLRKLQDERDALFERLARVSADFKNAQKRLQQEKEQAVEYANSALLKGLLPVLDSFERALTIDPSKSDAASILKGMQIVHDQWMKAMAAQGVEEIAPEPGTPFDPAHHQALLQQTDDRFKDHREPVVTQLLQKGLCPSRPDPPPRSGGGEQDTMRRMKDEG